MKLVRSACFLGALWFTPPVYAQCPIFYDVPCGLLRQNPALDPGIFPSPEERTRKQIMGAMFNEQMQDTCDTTGLKFPKLVMIWQNRQVVPDYCSKTAVCNNTACIEFGSPTNLFTQEIKILPEDLNVVLHHEETLILNITKIKILERRNETNDSNVCHAHSVLHSSVWDFPFQNLSSSLNVWDDAAIVAYRNFCRDQRVYDFTFFVKGPLDQFFCSPFVVCSFKKCLLFSAAAQKYAKILPISSSTCSLNSYPELPICSAIQINSWFFGRRRRRWPIGYRTAISLFHLPFSKYCGPGTDVIYEDDTGGPVGDLDAACRLHDIAYMVGDDPAKADEELLERVFATGSPYYYAFWLAIKVKQAFEAVTGKSYTSALYVTPAGTSATFAHYFYFKSVFDGLETNSTQLKVVKEKEVAWRNAVLDIWRGQCYVQRRPGSDSDAGSDKNLDVRPSTSQTASSVADTPTIDFTLGGTLGDGVIIATDYPPPPTKWAPCRVVINEIQTNNGLSKKSFIELLKVCPDKSERSRTESLRNYYLAVVKAADPIELHVLIDLSKQSMQAVQENVYTAQGHQTKNIYYFVVGSTNVAKKDMNLVLGFGSKNGIPSGSTQDATFSVVLLYSESLQKFSQKFKSKLPVPLSVEDTETMGVALQDIVTYGVPCKRLKCSTFIKWNLGLVQLDDDADIVSIPDQEDNKLEESINRCSNAPYPMQQESWEKAQPSPQEKNTCSVKVDPIYTFKSGSSIQSSAQYVIMNVRHFFHAYKQGNPQQLMEGSEIELTAKATGVSQGTVRTIYTRQQAGTIQTPRGRKRKRLSRALCRFTEDDETLIKEYIQGKYKSNLPPYFDDIYESSLRRFNNDIPPRNMCGKKTFRRLLSMMGFHFGRIDALIVVLQRPDIVAKRGVFLKKMKENEESENPKPVIYTDESWIDPHARSGKAWVPWTSKVDHKERLKYTYGKHHTNRGQRIIMIHAGGPKGLIHDSEAVFEVGGSKQAGLPLQDYHDNIESTFYFEWFRKLCININKEYEQEAIIVIDNAPYHTKSDAPKSNARKHELLDYLLAIDNDGQLTGFDKTKSYYRAELWQFVMQYKKDNTDHYLIDRLAKEYGHTVIRLPPHQCDFNPIEMLWHQGKEYVRKNNPDQTLETVKEKIKTFFITYPADRWTKLEEHTKKLRDQYWVSDKLYDEFLDKHEDRIYPDPQIPNEDGLTNDEIAENEIGPLDCYMHAGSDITFDDNMDIVVQGGGTNEGT